MFPKTYAGLLSSNLKLNEYFFVMFPFNSKWISLGKNPIDCTISLPSRIFIFCDLFQLCQKRHYAFWSCIFRWNKVVDNMILNILFVVFGMDSISFSSYGEDDGLDLSTGYCFPLAKNKQYSPYNYILILYAL